MALTGALLLMMILSAALGSVVIVAGIERRVSAAYRVSVELREAAEGAAMLTAGELQTSDWEAALAGGGSAHWALPQAGLDLAALTARNQAETMMGGAYGADTPVWRVFAQAPWPVMTGATADAGAPHVVTWVADDWQEADGSPGRDSNGRILVRAAALRGPASAWLEGVGVKEPDGRVRLRHVRTW